MIFPFGDDVPTRRPPIVTCAVIGLNVLVLLWINVQSNLNQERVLVERGFIPVRLAQALNGRPIVVEIEGQVRQRGLVLPVAVKKQFELPADRRLIASTLVTSLFLHGGWIHLLGNMWFLWIFGNNVEDRLGHFTYAAFYLGGGVLANICHWWSDPQSQVPVVGASGAVATVLGAYAVTWPWAHVRCIVVLVVFVTVLQLPALAVLGFWFLTQVLEASQQVKLGLQGGVAFWAHIGGFLAGMVMMPLLAERPPQAPRPAVEHELYDDRW